MGALKQLENILLKRPVQHNQTTRSRKFVPMVENKMAAVIL